MSLAQCTAYGLELGLYEAIKLHFTTFLKWIAGKRISIGSAKLQVLFTTLKLLSDV